MDGKGCREAKVAKMAKIAERQRLQRGIECMG
jgi:hypothetical protein